MIKQLRMNTADEREKETIKADTILQKQPKGFFTSTRKMKIHSISSQKLTIKKKEKKIKIC